MNKKDFIREIAEKTGKKNVEVTEIIDTALDIITSTVSKKEDVSFTGFGIFSANLQKGKSGKVPGTDKTYTTQDKMVPKFKAGKSFKDTVAG